METGYSVISVPFVQIALYTYELGGSIGFLVLTPWPVCTYKGTTPWSEIKETKIPRKKRNRGEGRRGNLEIIERRVRACEVLSGVEIKYLCIYLN